MIISHRKLKENGNPFDQYNLLYFLPTLTKTCSSGKLIHYVVYIYYIYIYKPVITLDILQTGVTSIITVSW